jgi:hypothetical protein
MQTRGSAVASDTLLSRDTHKTAKSASHLQRNARKEVISELGRSDFPGEGFLCSLNGNAREWSLRRTIEPHPLIEGPKIGGLIQLASLQEIGMRFGTTARLRKKSLAISPSKSTRWGAAFPGNLVPMCMIGGKCACLRAKTVEISGHLPSNCERECAREHAARKGSGWLGEDASRVGASGPTG